MQVATEVSPPDAEISTPVLNSDTPADTTPQWVTVVIVVLGSIVTALSTLLSVGAYAALREALKTFVKVGEILATFTATKTDDEFIKRFKAALKLEAESVASPETPAQPVQPVQPQNPFNKE